MTIAQLINYLIAVLFSIYHGHPPVVEDHPWPTTTTTQAPTTTAPPVSHPAVTIPEYTPPVSIPGPTITEYAPEITGPTFTICLDEAGNMTENC